MPRARLPFPSSSSQMTEFGNLSLKMKDLSWDNSVKDSMNDRRKSSIALGGQEGEPSRLQDDIGPPMSIEERLAMLEREVAQLTTNTAYDIKPLE